MPYMVSKFNIRVYGIWIKGNKILVSHEEINGFKMLKLPGGGLEYGEGPMDCVKREFMEELGVNITIERHVHTTENFVQSAFKKADQVIAIHYLVNTNDPIQSMTTAQPTRLGGTNYHRFEWQVFDKELIGNLTFDMDKQAIVKLV
jgi:ADP-ribose pyrophosphatase YjhB (NUDIX family)